MSPIYKKPAFPTLKSNYCFAIKNGYDTQANEQIFEWTKALTNQFRDALVQRQKANSINLTNALENIRRDFALFKARPLEKIDESTANILVTKIQIGEAFSKHTLLKGKQTATAEIEKATSEEGLKLLKAKLSRITCYFF